MMSRSTTKVRLPGGLNRQDFRMLRYIKVSKELARKDAVRRLSLLRSPQPPEPFLATLGPSVPGAPRSAYLLAGLYAGGTSQSALPNRSAIRRFASTRALIRKAPSAGLCLVALPLGSSPSLANHCPLTFWHGALGEGSPPAAPAPRNPSENLCPIGA